MSLADDIRSDLEGLFYSSSEFGSSATVGANTVAGIFHAPGSEALGIGGTKPVFRCASARVEEYGIEQGTELVHGGVTYKVASLDPDGHGETFLTLREA